MLKCPRKEILGISGRLHSWLNQLRSENRSMEVSGCLPDSLDRASNWSRENAKIFRYNQNLEKITSIKSAIKRIKNGNFGICMLCGKEINIKRLMAKPDTNYCIKCITRDEMPKIGS